MALGWTTRCCSAFALITVFSVVAAAAEQPTPAPLSLFPVDGAWDLALNNILEAPPAFRDDRGYFPLGGQIAAYDVRRGTLLWMAPGHPLFELIPGGGLLFGVESDAIVALHDDTGVEAWRYALAEPLAAPLAWHDGWLVAATASGTVLAFRASDGGLIWQRDLGALIHTSVSLADGRVYVPMTDGRIVALQGETGEPLWERRLGGAPNEILATARLIYSGSTDNYLYAIRARDGIIDWRWPTGADVVGRPIVDSHRVYFVSLDNVLRALDKNTGNQRWKRALPIRPTRGLVMMGDVVIVSGLSASATAFAMKDGSPVGSMAGPGELAAAPHVVAGEGLPMLVLVSRDLAKGTIVRAVTRSIEPAPVALAPLPNPVPPPTAPSPLPADSDQPADTGRATEDAVMP